MPAVLSRDRSRSPRAVGGRKCGWKAWLVGLYSARAQQVLSEIEQIMDAHTRGESEDEIGASLHQAAERLKGVWRKAAQLMGDRAEFVPSPQIRARLRGLQKDCEQRHVDVLKTQIQNASLGVDPERIEVVNAGTIAEMSSSYMNGEKCAVKTVNPESEAMFREDFDLVNGYLATTILNLVDTFLAIAGLGDTGRQIRASIQLLFKTMLDRDFQSNLLNEFRLQVEHSNSESALNALADPGQCCTHRVPRTLNLSADGKVLVLQWVNAITVTEFVARSRVTSVEMQGIVIQKIATFYFDAIFRRRRLHRDLHPGNLMIQENAPTNDVWIVDFGAEIEFAQSNMESMQGLLEHMYATTAETRDGTVCKTEWERLGVTTNRPEDTDQFLYFCKGFDLVVGSQGLNLEENFKRTQDLTMPPWVLLWQQATAALVTTLRVLRRLPQSHDVNVHEIVRQALGKVLEHLEQPAQSA